MIPEPKTYDLTITGQESGSFSATLVIEKSDTMPFAGNITIQERRSPLNGRTFPLDLCQVNEPDRQVAFRLSWAKRMLQPGQSRSPLLFLFVGTWNPQTAQFEGGKVTLPLAPRDSGEDPTEDADWQSHHRGPVEDGQSY